MVLTHTLNVICRAARFCNGAAHGGQVVGSAAVVPSLLQAWGCDPSAAHIPLDGTLTDEGPQSVEGSMVISPDGPAVSGALLSCSTRPRFLVLQHQVAQARGPSCFLIPSSSHQALEGCSMW